MRYRRRALWAIFKEWLESLTYPDCLRLFPGRFPFRVKLASLKIAFLYFFPSIISKSFATVNCDVASTVVRITTAGFISQHFAVRASPIYVPQTPSTFFRPHTETRPSSGARQVHLRLQRWDQQRQGRWPNGDALSYSLDPTSCELRFGYSQRRRTRYVSVILTVLTNFGLANF